MPNSEKIELLISPEALKQFEQLKASTDANTASFEKLIAKAVELNKAVGSATTFKEINKATAEMTENEKALAKQVDELAKANAKLQALFDQQAKKIQALSEAKKKQREDEKQSADAVTKAEEKLINSYSAEARKLAEIREQQNLVNKANKQSAQETLGLTGAYKQLEQQYTKAAQEAKDLAIQLGAGSKEAKEASARALELDARLKAADANTGKFNRNVGNYSGALNTLQKALQEVSKRIEDNTRSGIQNEAVMQALQKEQGLLVSLVDAQSKGFANATSEIRNNQQAILLLSQVYGEDSAVVTELTSKTAQLADTVGDMKATIKAQASDTHVFDGLIGAAQGLVGIYSVAQGAAALFGDENEELQKTFVKLQAVMSVLQGLQSIQNVLQKESAARQLINIGLQKVANIQTALQTAAESKSIVVRYAAIVAQKALNLAMSAAGGPFLAIIGIITLVVLSLKSFAAQASTTKKALEQLTAEFDRDLKALQDYSEFVKRNGDEIIASMEAQFASERDIRIQRTKNTQEQLQAALELEKEYGYQVDQEQAKLIRVLKKNADDRTDKEKEALEKQDELIQKFREQQKKRQDLAAQLRIQQSQNLQANTEETIKAQQEEIEATKLQLQTRQQLQQSIAADERKTQKGRIEALKESARIQRQLINADADSRLLTPGLTPTQIKLIETQRTASLTQARRESNKAIEDLNRAYAERERKARFDIVKLEIEDQIKAADLIANNEAKSFEERTDAIYTAYEKRRQLITANYEFELQQAIKNGAIAEERIALEEKALSEINQLTIEYGLQQQAIYQDNTDKVNEIIEKGLQRRKNIISSNESDTIVALNDQLKSGLITIDEYNRQRGKIEKSARIQQIKEEINDLTGKKIILISQQKQQSNEFIAIEEAEKKKRKELSDELTDDVIANEQRLTDLKKQLAAESFETFTSLVNSQFDNESARIQQQIDELDKQKEKDTEVANATIANKQEREFEIAKIEAIAQARREQLENRQRRIQLEQARFQKASNIAEIIGSTAVAIIKQLSVTPLPAGAPLVAAIAAIGALQLARAIATPLPKFAEGTDDAPGGLAWVGDGYKKEFIVTPQGQIMQTPAVPTVMNVPKHSIVLPDARAALESGLAVNRYGRLVQQDNGDIKEVGRKIDSLTKVMRNKPVLNMNTDQGGLTAMWKYGANWVTYAEDQTRF